MMQTILQENLLNHFSDFIPDSLRDHRMVVITDDIVEKLYAPALIQHLQKSGLESALVTFPAGEASKNRETKAFIESSLLAKKFDRQTCLIALGGGVVGDLVGFVAATYLRGVPYIQVPTTLMAMVDSSIGGKTGVNTPEGKNLIGAFWQPKAILADLNCLKTLSTDQLRNGWVEMLKIFLVADQGAAEQLMGDSTFSLSLIERAISLKHQIVSEDLQEKNRRAILNFGHTVGHAIEAVMQYQIPHGFAVAYGIWVEARLSFQKGLLSAEAYQRIKKVLLSQGFNSAFLQVRDYQTVLNFAQQDKKNQGHELRMILLNGIGSVEVNNQQFTHGVTEQAFQEAWNSVASGE